MASTSVRSTSSAGVPPDLARQPEQRSGLRMGEPHSGRLEGGERLRVLPLVFLALGVHRLPRRGADRRLIFRRQRGEEPLAHHQRLHQVHPPDLRPVGSHLEEALREVVRPGGLGAVDHPLFERRIDLPVSHGERVRPERFEGPQVERVLHGPDLETGKILRPLDHPVPGHDVPEARFEIAEQHEPPFGEGRLETPPDGPVEHLVHVGPVAEQVRQVEDQQLGSEGGERRVRGSGQLDRSDDRQLDDVPLVAEGVVRVDLDRDAAVRRRLDLAREDLEPLDRRFVRGGAGAGLDRDPAFFGSPAAGDERESREDGGGRARHHSIPSQRGRIVTASGKTVISTSTATMASTGRTVQPAMSLMLRFAMVQATNRVAP